MPKVNNLRLSSAQKSAGLTDSQLEALLGKRPGWWRSYLAERHAADLRDCLVLAEALKVPLSEMWWKAENRPVQSEGR
jgi:hypothetical protein